MDDRYLAGDRAVIRLRNDGSIAYRYQTIYQACFLTFREASGRTFKIPPGTHCDILSEGVLRPGDTVRLFEWDLDECVRDRWGCVKARPLAPGTYLIEGRFLAAKTGEPIHVETSFEVAPSY